MAAFRFQRFSIANDRAALKVGTDAVLLGASMSLLPGAMRLLDIGTGTGVIALMAAQRLEGSSFNILAIDIDAPSAEEAADNFAASPWRDSLHAAHMSLQELQAGDPGLFDHIFSNPPYYDSSLLNPDAREATARHTESLSYREICSFASEHLSSEGRLSLILPAEAEKMLVRTAASFGLYPMRMLRIRTTPKKPLRRIVAEFSKIRPESILEDVLTLQDGSGRSAEYSSLTEGFYIF